MKKEMRIRKYIKYIVKYFTLVFAVFYFCLCLSMHPAVRESSFAGEECMLYYMVNADGMKGLGHSILMVVDEKGCGTVLSFNGMQCSPRRALWERAALGN